MEFDLLDGSLMNDNNNFFSNFIQQSEIHCMQFDESQICEHKNKINSRISQISTQKMNFQGSNLNYKNFPKLIGNKFVMWIKRKKISKIPNGIANLIKQKDECQQPNFKIKDLQEACYDKASQIFFQEFIEDELFVNLIGSNKISDPYQYIPGISNYYAAAKEPQKMKSNYLTRNEYVDQKMQN